MFENAYYYYVLPFVIALGLLQSSPVLAADVLETTDEMTFSAEGQSVSGLGLEGLPLEPIEVYIPILLEETGPIELAASKRFIADYGTATRTGDLELDLFCGEDEFGYNGDCYSCSGNFDSASSITASTIKGEAICVDVTDVSSPIERGPGTLFPECPVGAQFNFLSGVCHDECPAGASFDSISKTCVETILVPVAATCPSGVLVGNQCMSCDSDRELVFDPFNGGASCKKESSLSKMVVVGEDTTVEVCVQECTPKVEACAFGSCVTITPKICVDVCEDVPFLEGRVTAFPSSGKYYDCPSSHPTQDPFVSFNNNGICRKNYPNVAATTTTPDCPGDIQPALGLCAGDIQTTVALYETPGVGCEAGSFLDDQKPGYCFYCKETDIWTPSDPIFNPGAPDSCTAASLGILADNEPTLGCDSGFPFVDPLDTSNQGCYSCDVDGMAPTLVFPLTSDKACFGITESNAPGSLEVGFSFNGEVGLRMGLKNEITLENETVDVSYSPKVTTRVEPDPTEPSRFKLIAELAEGAPDISTTTPGAKFVMDAYTEFYANAELEFKYIDFDLTTGLPYQAVENVNFVNVSTSGDESGEIGPLGYGVDYTRLFLLDAGLGRAELEYFELPDISETLPLPELQAEFETESTALPNPDFDLVPSVEINVASGLFESLESTLGWAPIKTFRWPSLTWELACKLENHEDKFTSADRVAYQARHGFDPFINDEKKPLPPCREFTLADISVAAYNTSTPPTSQTLNCFGPSLGEDPSLVKSCFNGLWISDFETDNAIGVKRQFLGTRPRSRDPFAPYDPFYSPPAQTTDFFRFALDLDGLQTLVNKVPMGQQFKFKYATFSYDLVDLDLVAYFAWSKTATFTPELEVTFSFSEPVKIDGVAVSEYTMPVRTQAFVESFSSTESCEDEDEAKAQGIEPLCRTFERVQQPDQDFNEVEFVHTGGDLVITKSFSVGNNRLLHEKVLGVEPTIEGKLGHLTANFKKQPFKTLFSALPAVTALSFTGDTQGSIPINLPFRSETTVDFIDVDGAEVLRISVPDLDRDNDGDGLRNGLDNCVEVSNADQANLDGDELGDVCDSDADGDGYLGSNFGGNDPDDFDASNVPDSDGDGFGDNEDNCVNVPNPSQADFDDDGAGDACDTDFFDSDDDAVADIVDNCVFDSNFDQIDVDNDGLGDACDPSVGAPVLVDFDFYPDGTTVQDRDERGTEPYSFVGLVVTNADNPNRPPRIEQNNGSFSSPNFLRERDGRSSRTTLTFATKDPQFPQEPLAIDVVTRLEFVVLSGASHQFELYDEFGIALTPDQFTVRREKLARSGVLYIIEGRVHRVVITEADDRNSEFDDILFHLNNDGDDIRNVVDNCIDVANNDQADLDQDGLGDVCDEDRDGDGSLNDDDIYPDDPSRFEDNDAPVITPNSQTLEFELAAEAGSLLFTGQGISAFDEVDGEVAVNCGSDVQLDVGLIYQFTCRASDDAGNIAFADFVVHVRDVTPPVITPPSVVTIDLPDFAATVTVPHLLGLANDAVQGAVPLVCDQRLLAAGTHVVTCTATDASGNSAAVDVTVIVQDVTPPTLLMPADFTIELGSNDTIAQIDISQVVATDNSGASVSVQCDATSFGVGVHTLTCTAMDAAGNVASGTTRVTVVDVTPPTLVLPPNANLEGNTLGGATYAFAATATDAVDGAITPVCSGLQSVYPLGLTTIQCAVSDSSGNQALASFQLMVVDTTPPAFAPIPSAVIELDGNSGALDYTLPVLFGYDIVDGEIPADCGAQQVTLNVGVNALSCSVTDNSGLTTTQNFSVTVLDTTPPVLTVPESFSLEGNTLGGGAYNFVAMASDSVDGALIPVCDGLRDVYPLGVTTVQCSVTDAAGNVSAADAQITVVDTTAPALDSIESQVVNLAAGQSTVSYTLPNLIGNDTVDGEIASDCNAQEVFLNVGLNPFSCSVTDASGNTTVQNFTVTVIDAIPPTLTVPADVELEFGADSSVFSLGTATAIDAVDGALVAVFSDEVRAGEGATVQVIQRTWSATDAAGNVGTAVQVIQLLDTTPPTLLIPASVDLFVGDATEPTFTGTATASDVYDPFVTVSYVDTVTVGTGLVTQIITREWNATDSAGNAASGTQMIVVSEVDTQPTVTINAPVLSGTIPLSVDLSSVVESGNGPFSYQWSLEDATYTTSTIQLSIETAGIYLVQLSVTDKNGDVASASVTVEATEVPIDDLLAEIAVLKANRQAIKLSDQDAQATHKLQVEGLRANIRSERESEKARHEQIKQTVASLRDARKATKDPDLKIELSDQIAAQYAARQESAVLSLQRIQLIQREIGLLRDQRHVARHARVAAVLEINEAISAIRLEIRQRQTGSSAERDLVDQEIFELESQRRDLREQQSLLSLETRDAIAALQDQNRLDRLAIKIAQKSKSDEIRSVRALLRREKDSALRVALKFEVDGLKAESKSLRDAASAENSAVKAEIALIREGNKFARDNNKAAQTQLRDQIKALRQTR